MDEPTWKSAVAEYANVSPFPAYANENKQTVLRFMREREPFCATAGPYADAVTGEEIWSGWG